jgi:hypothetical protein
MQVMINSLNQMPLSPNRVSGPQGISVLMANSLMFQRAPEPVEATMILSFPTSTARRCLS